MNITIQESKDFFKDFLSLYKESNDKKVVFCPSFTTLSHIISHYSNVNNISFGAQNVSNIDSGAHTGEISASMLKESMVKYCIVGHSERRCGCHSCVWCAASGFGNTRENRLYRCGYYLRVCS
mgnify:CR=1 FL=1